MQVRPVRGYGTTVRIVVRIKVRKSHGGGEWTNSGWECRLSVCMEPSCVLWRARGIMATERSNFEYLVAALQFPKRFSENPSALRQSLCGYRL